MRYLLYSMEHSVKQIPFPENNALMQDHFTEHQVYDLIKCVESHHEQDVCSREDWVKIKLFSGKMIMLYSGSANRFLADFTRDHGRDYSDRDYISILKYPVDEIEIFNE